VHWPLKEMCVKKKENQKLSSKFLMKILKKQPLEINFKNLSYALYILSQFSANNTWQIQIMTGFIYQIKMLHVD
jgi:hypothetical protein